MEIVVGLLLCLIAAVIPLLIYAWFVYWLDQHEKEPWWLLGLAFLWGAIPAVILSLIAQITLDIPTTWVAGSEGLGYDIIGGSLSAPVTEEIFKGMGVLLILLLARREFDSVLDGIIYGAMAGLGFAFTENILYFGGALIESGWGGWITVVLLRTIPFGLNHAFYTGLFGAGIGWAVTTRFGLAKPVIVSLGLVMAMIAHSLHNLGSTLAATNCLSILISLVANWGGILLLGVVIALIWRQERGWITRHLAGEVNAETLALVTSWRRWQGLRWGALLKGDLGHWRKLGQLRHVAAELAFKKQQLLRLGEQPQLKATIDSYRTQLIALGAMTDQGVRPTDSPLES